MSPLHAAALATAAAGGKGTGSGGCDASGAGSGKGSAASGGTGASGVTAPRGTIAVGAGFVPNHGIAAGVERPPLHPVVSASAAGAASTGLADGAPAAGSGGAAGGAGATPAAGAGTGSGGPAAAPGAGGGSAGAKPGGVSLVRAPPTGETGGDVSGTGVRVTHNKVTYCVGVDGALRTLRSKVSKKKKRFTEGDFDLDLTYITPRIIAMGFPSSGREGLYRNPLPEVQRFFETRHPGHFRIYNLCSERAYDPVEFGGQVCRFPFDDHNPSPLEQIPEFCSDVDAWMNAHPENVVAIHCKAGKGRTGQMISAYLLHCGLRPTAEAALQWFGYKRTANGHGVTIPSQMRFVHYYEALLRNGTPPVFCYRLLHLRLRTTPMADISGGCTPYFAVYNNGVLVFDYRKHAVAPSGKKLRRYKRGEPYVDIDLTRHDVRVQGNIKIQLYHEAMAGNVKLCHFWFHTGFIARNYLSFSKSVIDKANKDKRGVFAPNFGVELFFTRLPPDDMPSPPMPAGSSGSESGAASRSGRSPAALSVTVKDGGSGSDTATSAGGGAFSPAAKRVGGGGGTGASAFPTFSLGHHRSPFTSAHPAMTGGDLYEDSDGGGGAAPAQAATAGATKAGGVVPRLSVAVSPAAGTAAAGGFTVGSAAGVTGPSSSPPASAGGGAAAAGAITTSVVNPMKAAAAAGVAPAGGSMPSPSDAKRGSSAAVAAAVASGSVNPTAIRRKSAAAPAAHVSDDEDE